MEAESPPAQQATAPGQLRPLTGLRFVAAVLVVAFHFLTVNASGGSGPLHVVTALLQNVAANGYSGVGFFFILSGFILTYNYLSTQGRLRVGRRAFWLARFARIYPVYLLALALAFLPSLPSGQNALADVDLDLVVAGVANLMLLQAWLPGTESVWNPPGWSLSAEAFFYLLFPLLVVGIVRLKARWLLGAVVAAWSLTALVALAYLALAPDGAAYQGSWFHRHWLMVLYLNPLARLPEFLIGVALGRLFVLRTARAMARQRVLFLSPGLLSALALGATAAGLAIEPFPITLFNQVMLDPLFALLIYALAHGEGRAAAFFALSPLILLGEASYAMYILHWPLHLPVWNGVNGALQLLNPDLMGPRLFFVIYLGIVVAVGIVSLRTLERPARRAIRRLFARRSAGAAPASS